MIPAMTMRSRLLLIAAFILSTATLTVSAADPAAAPVITTRADGLLEATTSAPGAVVRYTLDGSEPDRGAGVWLAPVNLPAGYTLKARAFSADGEPIGDVAVRQATPGASRTASTLVPVTQNRDWRIYDWAERHAACVALMKSRQPEIVMLGDSITHFWGGEPVGGRRTGADVWDRFFANHTVVNLGFGWDRTENVLWRLTHGEFDHANPTVVVVMIGTNNMDLNTPDEIAAGISAICEELHRRAPAAHILLLGIFPRGASPDATRQKVASVNERLARLDGRNGVTYLDIGRSFLEADGSISAEVMYDHLHPTAKGYALWVAAMEPTLRRLLAK
jgi:lysophospholipase L1-like esterase